MSLDFVLEATNVEIDVDRWKNTLRCDIRNGDITSAIDAVDIIKEYGASELLDYMDNQDIINHLVYLGYTVE